MKTSVGKWKRHGGRIDEKKRTVVEIDDVPYVRAAPIHHPVVPVEGQLEAEKVQKSRLSMKGEDGERSDTSK